MRKMYTTNACIFKTRQDIKISSTYFESAANFTSDRCGNCNFINIFEKLQIIDLDDLTFQRVGDRGAMSIGDLEDLLSYQKTPFDNFCNLWFEIETS